MENEYDQFYIDVLSGQSQKQLDTDITNYPDIRDSLISYLIENDSPFEIASTYVNHIFR